MGLWEQIHNPNFKGIEFDAFAFWNEVDKVMPDYGERKMWLKKHGAGLDL